MTPPASFAQHSKEGALKIQHSRKKTDVNKALNTVSLLPGKLRLVRKVNSAAGVDQDKLNIVVFLPDVAFQLLVDGDVDGFVAYANNSVATAWEKEGFEIEIEGSDEEAEEGASEATPSTLAASLNSETDSPIVPGEAQPLEQTVTELAGYVVKNTEGIENVKDGLINLTISSRDAIEALKQEDVRLNDALGVTNTSLGTLDGKVAKLSDEVAKQGAQTIKVEWVKPVSAKPKTSQQQNVPAILPKILAMYAAGIRNIYLWGEAGTGKSYLGKLVADSLGIPFFSQSFSPDTGKVDFEGWVLPNGKYRTTAWAESFEKPSVMLCDEWDNLYDGTAVMLNDPIENGRMVFPDNPLPKVRDPQQLIMATGNTPMRGATVGYSARVRHDQATIQRWFFIEVKWDEQLARHLVKSIAPAIGDDIVDWGLKVRDYVKTNSIPGLICSMREMAMFAKSIQELPGEQDFCLEGSIFKGYTPKVVAEIVQAVGRPCSSGQ
jgi:hypothetical protein